VGIDLASVVTVDRSRNVLDELTQSHLVIGSYAFACGSAFSPRSHGRTIPPPALDTRRPDRARMSPMTRRFEDQLPAKYDRLAANRIRLRIKGVR
jgi:hypothetical protein